VGVALLFLFLPVNIPLWNILFSALELNISGEFTTPPMFLLGLLFLFYPTQKDIEQHIAKSTEEE